MTISSSSFGRALFPGVNKWYGDAYNEYPVEYTDIFETHTSRKAWEEDVLYSGFGLAQVKLEGSAVSYDTAVQGFIDRYQHVEFALGFIITKTMVEDDQYDVIGKKKASALGMSARQTKETNAANILNRAFNGNYTYGDGVALCVNNHPNVAGGTWSNIPTVSVDISEAALEQAFIDIAGYTNDRGLKIAVRPKRIIVPKELDFEVNKILETQYEVGTSSNTVNIVRSRYSDVKLNHYLTDTDAWFLITDVKEGMKYFERRADEFTMDDDFGTDNALFKFTTRYSFGATDKRAIYGSAGA